MSIVDSIVAQVTDHRPEILAIDPGPSVCGWAVIHVERGGMCSFSAAGMEDSGPGAFRAQLYSAARVGALVAIEIPVAMHPRPGASPANLFARSKQLLATRDVATRLATEARHLALDVVELSAGQWRHALTRKNNASNALIKQAVSMLCKGLPRRTNAHTRDSVGLAIVASWRPR